MKTLFRTATALLLAFAAGAACANEAAIRKALAAAIPTLPKIDEVRPSPMPGVFEVRAGTTILYSDAKGEHVIEGALIETKTMTNLTEVWLSKLTAVDFAALPLKDAVVYKQGSGARRLAVFVDPLCGYCKRFERDLVALKDVTIYTFIYPILGPESSTRSRDIWCAKEPAKAWRSWMVDNVVPPRIMGTCDTGALDRNVAFGQKYRVNGTPATFFEDGTRKAGALPGAEVEKMLVAATTATATRKN